MEEQSSFSSLILSMSSGEVNWGVANIDSESWLKLQFLVNLSPFVSKEYEGNFFLYWLSDFRKQTHSLGQLRVAGPGKKKPLFKTGWSEVDGR